MTDTSVIIKALEHIYADTIEVTNGEPVTKQLSEALSPLIAVFPTEDELLKLFLSKEHNVLTTNYKLASKVSSNSRTIFYKLEDEPDNEYASGYVILYGKDLILETTIYIEKFKKRLV